MKLIKYTVFAILMFCCKFSHAQSERAIAVSQKISQQMTDSLGLTEGQKSNLNQINLKLHSLKMEIRNQFAETDSLAKYMQRIENTRDSLYREVLEDEKFKAYLRKKNAVVNNN